MKTYFYLVLCILWSTSGCLDLSQKKPDAKEDHSEDAKPQDPQQPSGDPTPSNGSDDEDDDNDTDSDSGDGSNALKALLEECGADDLAGIPDDKVYYESKIVSLPITKSLLGLSLTAITNVDVKISKKEYTRITAAEIDANVLPSVAQRVFGAPNSGPTVSTTVPFSDASTLSQTPSWKGVICTFVGAKKIVNERGNYKTVIEFDPAMPVQISPKAKVSRFDKEIGDKKIFDGIKAKIVETDNPKLETGATLDITVTVEKVARDTIIEDSEGNMIEVHADSAYKITTASESPDVVMAMGLDPENTFYLKNSEKKVLWNVLDTKSTIKGILKFNHNP